MPLGLPLTPSLRRGDVLECGEHERRRFLGSAVLRFAKGTGLPLTPS